MRRHTIAGFAMLVVLSLVYFPYIQIREAESGHDFIYGDGLYYFAMVASIVGDGDLYMNDDIPPSRSARGGQLALPGDERMDRLVPKHQILMPVIASPFYALFRIRGLMVFSVLTAIGVAFAMYLLGSVFVDRRTAFFTAAMFAVGTMLFAYTYTFYSDTLSTLFIVLSAYCAVGRHRHWAAIFLGLSVFAKISNAPLVALMSLYIVYDIVRMSRRVNERWWKTFVRLFGFGSTILVGNAPMLITNHLLYGSPFLTGYQRTVLPNGQLRDHVDEFNYPIVDGIWRNLFDGSDGIIATNPLVLLSVVGVGFALQHRRRIEILLIGALCMGQLIIFSKYEDAMASPFSSRFLMGAMMLSSVFAAFVVDRIRRRMMIAR